jgi:hypothetical protein
MKKILIITFLQISLLQAQEPIKVTYKKEIYSKTTCCSPHRITTKTFKAKCSDCPITYEKRYEHRSDKLGTQVNETLYVTNLNEKHKNMAAEKQLKEALALVLIKIAPHNLIPSDLKEGTWYVENGTVKQLIS